MLQLTLVVRMTGLLLLTPQTRAGALPMHVIMPAEGDSVPPHVAQLGWRSSPASCKHVFQDDVCWINMDDLSVEIGRGGSPSLPELPPPSAYNLSTVANPVRPVPASASGDSPGRRVRARISLYSGMFTYDGECAYALWTFPHKPLESVRLANVVTWQAKLPQGSFQIVRKALDPGTNPTQKPVITIPVVSTRVELFIRHIPATETESERAHRAHGRVGDKATHFHSYYDLLGSEAPADRKIPVIKEVLDEPCKWTKVGRNPGTPTCMVASGLPPE